MSDRRKLTLKVKVVEAAAAGDMSPRYVESIDLY